MKGKYKVSVENNRLRYEFEIKQNITIIRGDSATGKTILVNMLRQAQKFGASSGIELICEVPCKILEGENWKLVLENVADTIFFIDNGKTERDRVTLQKSSEELKIIVNYPGDKDETEGYFRSYKTNFSTYTEMTEKLLRYYSLIIPVKKFNKEKIGPLGITSFLDAVALCMPIITSNNTCFSSDVQKYQLGLVYEAGNKESLKQSMNKMYMDRQFYDNCTKNLQTYKKDRDISAFSCNLKKIIKNVMK